MRHDLPGTIRDLHRRRGRERRGRTLAEGIRLVEEALAAGVPIDGVAVGPALGTTPRGLALREALAVAGVHVEEHDEAAFGTLACTEHPQGIVAVITLPAPVLEEVVPGPGHPVIVLDGVQDPGNVGTIARTALALGASGLLALPGTAELANPKTVRASMGALFRLPALAVPDAGFSTWCTRVDVACWVAEAGGTDIRDAGPVPGRLALVVGNEGAGVRPEIESRAARRVGIPLAAGVESLNVAAAAAIFLHEVTRGS